MAPARRPVRLVALALALTTGLVACRDGGGEDDPVVGLDPPATSEGLPAPPAERCTAVLNERDADVARAGSDAALDVVLWARTEPPGDDEVAAAADAIEAWRDVLAADRERLAGAEVDDAGAWEEVLGLIEAELERLDERLAIATAPDVAAAAEDVEIGGSDAGADAAGALEALGLTGRDCEVIASPRAGVPADHADFVAEAATACATIVTRRRAEGYRTDQEESLAVLAAVVTDEEIDYDDDTIAAVRRLRDEWEATADDLGRVDAEAAIDPAGWRQVVDLAEQRAEGHGLRLVALEGGDRDEIAEVYVPGALGDPGWEGFAPNGLEVRDCRSIDA